MYVASNESWCMVPVGVLIVSSRQAIGLTDPQGFRKAPNISWA